MSRRPVAGNIEVITSAVRFAQTRSADAVESSIEPTQKLICVRNVIRLCIFTRDRDRGFIGVTGFNARLRKEFGRGDREDPCAGTDIKKTTAQ